MGETARARVLFLGAFFVGPSAAALAFYSRATILSLLQISAGVAGVLACLGLAGAVLLRFCLSRIWHEAAPGAGARLVHGHGLRYLLWFCGLNFACAAAALALASACLSNPALPLGALAALSGLVAGGVCAAAGAALGLPFLKPSARDNLSMCWRNPLRADLCRLAPTVLLSARFHQARTDDSTRDAPVLPQIVEILDLEDVGGAGRTIELQEDLPRTLLRDVSGRGLALGGLALITAATVGLGVLALDPPRPRPPSPEQTAYHSPQAPAVQPARPQVGRQPMQEPGQNRQDGGSDQGQHPSAEQSQPGQSEQAAAGQGQQGEGGQAGESTQLSSGGAPGQGGASALDQQPTTQSGQDQPLQPDQPQAGQTEKGEQHSQGVPDESPQQPAGQDQRLRSEQPQPGQQGEGGQASQDAHLQPSEQSADQDQQPQPGQPQQQGKDGQASPESPSQPSAQPIGQADKGQQLQPGQPQPGQQGEGGQANQESPAQPGAQPTSQAGQGQQPQPDQPPPGQQGDGEQASPKSPSQPGAQPTGQGQQPQPGQQPQASLPGQDQQLQSRQPGTELPTVPYPAVPFPPGGPDGIVMLDLPPMGAGQGASGTGLDGSTGEGAMSQPPPVSVKGQAPSTGRGRPWQRLPAWIRALFGWPR